MNIVAEDWRKGNCGWVVVDRDIDPYNSEGEFDGFEPVLVMGLTEAEARRCVRIQNLKRNVGMLPPRAFGLPT
jgi:hypothetical protein